MPIDGWSGDCQSNSGVQGYSDMGWGDIGVPIDGWSGDCQSNSGVQGYSDMGWGGYECQSTDGPETVRVTPMYRDTLTWGGDIGVPIDGWSRDCQSNSGVQGYSDIGVPIHE